jgi:DNA-binding NarL/FixJ family response regulator
VEWEQTLFEIPDSRPTPEEEVISQENADELFNSLTKKQQEIMVMVLDGWTRKEIADKIGCKNRNCVDTAMCRIRTRVKLFKERLK